MEIEKEDGSKGPLGIPKVKDRVVRQALLQIIEPIFEPYFLPSSYGYRPNRSCQMAVDTAEQVLRRYGLTNVVDMALSKCFDTLDHERINAGVNKKISDGRILQIVRQLLISPLLSIMYLD